MRATGYQYMIELLDRTGAPLSEVAVATDWEPARQCTRLVGLRQHRIGPEQAGEAVIEPVWHSMVGAPYISGFRVSLSADGKPVLVLEFPITYWKDYAQQASGPLVDEGRLKSGEDFLYQVAAYPADGSGGDERRAPRFTVQQEDAVFVCREGRLAHHLRRSVPVGSPNGHDMPVLIGADILDETEALKEEADGCETGGVLIGYLYRDATVPEMFAEVTAQIPARHAPAGETRLTFTPETWADVQAAIDLRGRGEMRLGWWHSHPGRHWAKGDGCEGNRGKGTGEFFSADDRLLHRAVFPAAYSIGLVLSDTPIAGELWTTSWTVYGWRYGSIERRGFNLAAVRGAVREELPRHSGGGV